MALRADGRAEFRQTEMPPNALCHLESRQPPAFELSANGHLTGGDQISRRAGDNRSSAYSVPQPKKLLPLCVRYGCLRGGRMACFWSKNSICDWQAGARRTRPRRPRKGHRVEPNLPLPLDRSLRRQRCIREQRGGLQDTLVECRPVLHRRRQRSGSTRLAPTQDQGTPILPSDCLSRDRSHKRSRLDLSSGRRRPKEDGGGAPRFLGSRDRSSVPN